MLTWYVMSYDYNTKSVIPYNVMYNSYTEEIKKARKNGKIKSREDLKIWLRKDLMYHYWCKAECEIVIGDLFNNEKDDLVNVDYWSQLEPNLDRIVDYIITELKLRFK